MFNYNQLAEKKSKLFTVVVFLVIGVLTIPIILPHIFHGTHIFHIFLHIAGIIVAAFLTMISLIAYSKIRTKRLLLTMLAFSVFIAAESFMLVEATWPFQFYLGDVSLVEISHVFILTMLGIFTLAVFRND